MIMKSLTNVSGVLYSKDIFHITEDVEEVLGPCTAVSDPCLNSVKAYADTECG